jgi:hypothetical protein
LAISNQLHHADRGDDTEETDLALRFLQQLERLTCLPE